MQLQKEKTLTAPRPHRQSSAYFSPPQAELRAPQPAAGGAPRDPARRRRSSARLSPPQAELHTQLFAPASPPQPTC